MAFAGDYNFVIMSLHLDHEYMYFDTFQLCISGYLCTGVALQSRLTSHILFLEREGESRLVVGGGVGEEWVEGDRGCKRGERERILMGNTHFKKFGSGWYV